MRYNVAAARETWLRAPSAETLDRILPTGCAAIWLAALGAGVAATVALVDLGRGHPQSAGTSETPWLLYTVIAVSAVVIAGAVPLLLRARRTAMVGPQAPATSAPPVQAPAESPIRAAAEPSAPLHAVRRDVPVITPEPDHGSAAPLAEAERLALRCGLLVASAMGVAMIAIGVATYLMAVDSNGAAWTLYGLAGLVTLGMAAIPWPLLRQLHAVVEASPR